MSYDTDIQFTWKRGKQRDKGWRVSRSGPDRDRQEVCLHIHEPELWSTDSPPK